MPAPNPRLSHDHLIRGQPERPWCVRRAEMKPLKLLTYGVIQLGLAVEAGAGRNEANPQQARK